MVTYIFLLWCTDVPSVVIGSGSAVVYGGQVTISCSISSNPRAQSMSWQKTLGGVTTTLDISNNPRYQGGTLSNPSLTISNLNLDDKGDYRCLATNTVGTGQSGPAVIDVTGGKPLKMLSKERLAYRIDVSYVVFIHLVLIYLLIKKIWTSQAF